MKNNSLRSNFWKKFIGSRAFYAAVLTLVIPMVLQDAITSFVGLLDNIMVGQTGTEQMSGVAIANQLLLVYNMSIFGGNGGAGIFAAQFHGRGDPDGVRHTLRYKLLMGGALSLAALALFVFFDEQLIGLFLHESADGGDLAAAMQPMKSDLLIVSFSSDWLFTTRQSEAIVKAALANNLNCSFCEIESSYGHDAFLLEVDRLGSLISDFLRNQQEDFQ
jgi:Na+-driven multidrug efflux pump